MAHPIGGVHVAPNGTFTLDRNTRSKSPKYARWTYNAVEPYLSLYGGLPATVPGLVVSAPGIKGRAQVAGVAARRLAPPGVGGLSPDRRVWRRDADFDHALERGYEELLYEVTVLEEPWEERGHTRAWPVLLRRERDPAAVASAIVEWSRYREEYTTAWPGAVESPRTRLAATAKAKLAALADGAVDRDLDPRIIEALTPDAGQALVEDLQHLVPTGILWHFPREASGALALSQVVLLAEYETHSTLPRRRSLWLCACGPTRRKDPPRVTLRLETVIAENHLHRWDEARWQWDERWRDVPLAERWGIRDAEQAAATTELLDHGQITAALEMWKIELDDRLARLLRGEPVQFGLREQTAVWSRRARDALGGSAPWLLAHAAERNQLVRQIWARTGRHRPCRPLRLFGLGVQNQQRRPGVFLVRSGERIRLTLDWSASNARVPATAWVRPVDYDLVRLGLIYAGSIPISPVDPLLGGQGASGAKTGK